MRELAIKSISNGVDGHQRRSNGWMDGKGRIDESWVSEKDDPIQAKEQTRAESGF